MTGGEDALGEVAVQLRASTNGETSSAVGNCFASGVPTVVTGIGAARDLPDDAVAKVPIDVTPEGLAAILADLLENQPRRTDMAAAARTVAHQHSFEQAATVLLAEIEALLPPL